MGKGKIFMVLNRVLFSTNLINENQSLAVHICERELSHFIVVSLQRVGHNEY